MKRAASLLSVLALTGCTLATCSPTTVVPARTAIPVECKEPIPARPAMPTEHLPAGADLDAFAAAAIAELERREGYEVQLVTALTACTRPVKP